MIQWEMKMPNIKVSREPQAQYEHLNALITFHIRTTWGFFRGSSWGSDSYPEFILTDVVSLVLAQLPGVQVTLGLLFFGVTPIFRTVYRQR